MFRSTKGKKKKPGRSIRRTIEDDSDDKGHSASMSAVTKAGSEENDDDVDDDGDSPNLALLLQKQRQRNKKKSKRKDDDRDSEKSGVTRTTVIANGKKKSSSRKRSRIGFGGATIEEEDAANTTRTHADSLYDSATLAQLKAEQSTWNDEMKEKEEKVQSSSTTENPSKTRNSVPPEPQESKSEQKKPGDFLSFDHDRDSNNNEPPILAGDEAFEMDLEQDAWQQQVAQRAGIASSATNPNEDSSKSNLNTPTINTMSLKDVQSQFVNVRSSLMEQIEDVEASLRRRENDIQQTEEQELKKHTDSVESCGRALEFYQSWRARAVPHVAALRDLAGKLDELQSALLENIARPPNLARSRRQLYIEDTLASLHQAKRLDKVFGKHPNPDIFSSSGEATTNVDEFGRSVKSQYELHREKRAQQRELIQSELQERENASSVAVKGFSEFDWMLNSEIEEWNTQRSALREALDFATSQVRPEFLRILDVVKLFSDWQKYDIQEYKDCFASLSLADLAGVLLRLNVCTSFIERDVLDKQAHLDTLVDSEFSKLEMEDEALFRLQEKSLIPFFAGLLKKKAYNVESVAGTKAMIQLFKFGEGLASTGSVASTPVARSEAWSADIIEPLLGLLKLSLEEISLPILPPPTQVSPQSNTVHSHEMAAAREQTSHVESVIRHIFEWRTVVSVHQFDTMLCQPILNFVQDIFLPFLSSLGPYQVSFASTSFSMVWGFLKTTNWLDDPENLIQSTTIQAAAEVYVHDGN